MENDRSVEPGLAIQYLQQFHGIEMARLAGEIAYRDAYIQSLEEKIKELQPKPKEG